MDEKEKLLIKKSKASIKYSRKCLTIEGEQRTVVKWSPEDE